MQEDCTDIYPHNSNNVNQFLNIKFDYVITLRDNAKQNCPYLPTDAQRFHQNFKDSAKLVGTEEEVQKEFGVVKK